MVEVTAEQGRRIVSERIQRRFGLTIDEFKREVENGSLDVANSHVAYLVMLLPLASPDK